MNSGVVEIPGGRTYREWHGPRNGPVAVCIHGLTSPSYMLAGTARSLAALGFRVLLYDLWGRGRSATPTGRQTPEWFLRQLEALLRHEEVSSVKLLLGYSMGGALAAVAASGPRLKVDGVILLGAAGLKRLNEGPRARLLTLPGLGEAWAATAAGGEMRKALRDAPLGPTIVPDLKQRLIAETRAPGYPASVLSARRHTLGRTYDAAHKALYQKGIPVGAIWGGADEVIGLKAPGRLAELNPDAHHVQIPGAGHAFPQTHPREVGEALETLLYG